MSAVMTAEAQRARMEQDLRDLHDALATRRGVFFSDAHRQALAVAATATASSEASS